MFVKCPYTVCCYTENESAPFLSQTVLIASDYMMELILQVKDGVVGNDIEEYYTQLIHTLTCCNCIMLYSTVYIVVVLHNYIYKSWGFSKSISSLTFYTACSLAVLVEQCDSKVQTFAKIKFQFEYS